MLWLPTWTFWEGCAYLLSIFSTVLPTGLLWKEHKTWWWHLRDPHTALPLHLRRAWRDKQQHPHVLVGHRQTPWCRSLCHHCWGSKKKLFPWHGCSARLVKSIKGQGDFSDHYSLDRSWILAHIGCSNASLLGTARGFSITAFIISPWLHLVSVVYT